MTAVYDQETTCDTLAAAYYDDPDTYTIAEAWMSSPLGEPDDDSTEPPVFYPPNNDVFQVPDETDSEPPEDIVQRQVPSSRFNSIAKP